MAAGYLQKSLKEKGIKDIEVRAAGVMTIPGLLATPEAIQVMDSVGVDLRRHRSSQLTRDLIRKADLILGMTPFHVQSALRVSDEARGKTFLFKEYTRSDLKNTQIVDPMGCTLEVYKKVFTAIEGVKGVTNPHRVRMRQLGNMYVMDIDIEVDGSLTVYEAHEIAHQVEEKVKKDIGNIYDMMIHVEPVGDDASNEKFGVSKKQCKW